LIKPVRLRQISRNINILPSMLPKSQEIRNIFGTLRLSLSDFVGNSHSGFLSIHICLFEHFLVCQSMFFVFLEMIHLEFGSGGLLSRFSHFGAMTRWLSALLYLPLNRYKHRSKASKYFATCNCLLFCAQVNP